MRLWVLGMGLLIIGLISPFFANAVIAVVDSYSDPLSQIILWGMLPLFVFIYAYMRLFGDQR